VFLITAFRYLAGHGSAAAGVLLALLFCAGVIAAIVRSFTGPDAKSPRGRLRAAAWNGALIALSVVLAGTLRWNSWGAVTAAAAAIVAFWPRLVRPAIAAGLIAVGLAGFAITRTAAFGVGREQSYGFADVDSADLTFYLLLPQAYLVLLAGGWVGWRSASSGPAWRRWLLGRLAEPDVAGRPWALLLLPVTVIAAVLVAPNLWFGGFPAGIILPVLLMGAAALYIRAAPGRAAGTAVAGLIAIGVAGVYFGATYSSAGWHLPANAAGYVEYGAIDVTSQTMANLAVLEGLAFAGAGLWLLPRVAPGVLRYAGLAGYRELAQRIQRLTETRAVAVDTAAADLRRLERDLHDGAQARLVALGMHLRAVEKLIPTNPDAALALVSEARETSARALTELRELVRGVHPPVLADRGLADAIRALALDSPLRMHADVDLPGRLPAPIETACYFAVAELVTNAAKHSGARDARITAEHRDGVLRIVVTDFGVGGAAARAGTGLAGVERRLATFDGILAVSSPVGGPTMVVIEIPCALSAAGVS
jgi:signal transduction histidine kinase